LNEILLLSGGIDSSALAAWRRPAQTLVIDYGQVSAAGEITAAQAVASELGLPVAVLRANCSAVGSGLLAGAAPDPAAPVEEWWPFRNQLLVTLAAAWALPRGLTNVVVGSVAGDGRHADGTVAFYDQLDILTAAQEGAVRVSVPAIGMTSGELVERSGISDSVLAWTHSCHRGPVACGDCPGCNKRRGVLHDLRRLV
jgi:7-cyano-7-deazaguanine synthase